MQQGKRRIEEEPEGRSQAIEPLIDIAVAGALFDFHKRRDKINNKGMGSL